LPRLLKLKPKKALDNVETPELKNTLASCSPAIQQQFKLPLAVVESICKYWLDKRKSHPQPLLRRLQEYSQESDGDKNLKKHGKKNTANTYVTMKLMRQGMERARILLDLMKKREETKKERVELIQQIVENQIQNDTPFPEDFDLSYSSDIINLDNFNAQLDGDLFMLNRKRGLNGDSSSPQKKEKESFILQQILKLLQMN